MQSITRSSTVSTSISSTHRRLFPLAACLLVLAAVEMLAFPQRISAATGATTFSDITDVLKAWALSFWMYDGVKVILSHIGLNLAMAVLAAWKTQTFTFAKLADFLKKVFVLAGGYYLFKMFGDATGFGVVSALIWASIEATLTASTANSLKELFGIEFPESLARLVAKQ